MGSTLAPFGADPVETIALDEPPLVRVLAQVRFSPVLRVADEAFVGAFQQALAPDYPLTSADTEFQITLPVSPEAPPTHAETRLWRFSSEDGMSRVTLATSFVALETARYLGHEDFLARLRTVLSAVEEHVGARRVVRTGVRYVQRLSGDDLERLGEYIRPEVLGVSQVDPGVDTSLTQARHLEEGVTLHARWGLLPAGVGLDIVPPADEPSWIFDIDVFDEEAKPFDSDLLVESVFDYSRRQYRFFRWAVNPAFLARFGADEQQLAALEEMMGA
jgi:uncharacterized protein (TIGR04255 family)